MFELLGVPPQALFGQVLLGLINGSFYAILSLGLAVIFGLLNIINFTHGAQYMMGAFVAWMCLNYLGLNYWAALLLAPIVVGATGIAIADFRGAIAQVVGDRQTAGDTNLYLAPSDTWVTVSDLSDGIHLSASGAATFATALTGHIQTTLSW